MRKDVTPRLPDFDVDARVRDNDGEAGDQEAESKKELLGRFASRAGQDSARERGGVQSKVSPQP